MFYFHHTLSTLLVYFLLLSASCHAIPTPYTLTTIFPREDGSSSGVQMVTTVTHIPTEAGNFIETCNIVLTPILGDHGESMVREERTCTISLDSSSGAPPSTTTSGGNGGSSPVMTLTSSAVNPSLSSSAVSSVSSVRNPNSSGSPVLKELVPPATHSSSSLTQSPSSNPTQSSSSTGSDTIPNNTNNSNPLNVSPAAAAAADVAESPFVPPGKKLSVLPIGLGIFAAISVIGLIIVAIVTYERTKHRKNFRMRKLAEAGAIRRL